MLVGKATQLGTLQLATEGDNPYKDPAVDDHARRHASSLDANNSLGNIHSLGTPRDDGVA